MKILGCLLTLIVVFCLINWVRGDSENAWPLPQVLPFMGGHHTPSSYDVGGLIMLAILISAIFGRAQAKADESSSDESEYEEAEAEEDDRDEDGDEREDDNGDEGDDADDDEEEDD